MMLFGNSSSPNPNLLGWIFDIIWVVVIVVTTVYSGIEYFAKNLDVFKDPS